MNVPAIEEKAGRFSAGSDHTNGRARERKSGEDESWTSCKQVPSRRVLALPEVQHERLTAFLPGLDQDVVHMRLDGAHGEEQLVGDLLVVLAQDD